MCVPGGGREQWRAPVPVTKYVRFEYEDGVSYGVWDDDFVWDDGVVRELDGGLFDALRPTGREFPASQVRLLVPCEPSKVLAVGLNYASHRKHVEGTEGVIRNAAGRPVSS